MTELTEDIAGRLLSADVSEYIRFRAMCRPWRELIDDSWAHGGLDIRFRPHHWFPLCREAASPSRFRLENRVTGMRVGLTFRLFSTSHYLSLADGLLVLRDKATHAVRLLKPIVGVFAKFPNIIDVRPHEGAPPNTRLGMDAFKARFPGLGPEPNAYIATEAYAKGYPQYPAFNAVLTYAGIDESTFPPTLQLCVRDESWLVLRAKPGDEYWVALYPPEPRNHQVSMLLYAYLFDGVSGLD
jgi:hypothetical protein